MDILRIIKDKLNSGKELNIDSIIEDVARYSIVSFDVFDTLLKRNVERPTDVFAYMEYITKNKYKDFKNKRIEAEKKARKNKNGEVTIEEIYLEYDGISNNDKKMLISLELESESKLLIANSEIKKVYDFCIDKGKTVYLISDIYLPFDFVEKILIREGFKGYKKLYLSCVEKKTKCSGELFKCVLNENNILPKRIIHIGDSIKSDYCMPRRLDISAIHIPTNVGRCEIHMENKKNIRINILNTFINNTTLIDKDQYYRFGYEKFGMFLWGYVTWLENQLQKENITNVYFFSRDGLIMKKAFDIINNPKLISTYYLEVSRRSLRVPILWMDCSLSTVLDMISPSKFLTLKTIFDGVGLDIRNYKELLKKYGFKIDTTFDRKKIEKNKRFKSFYAEIKSDIYQVSKNEYKVLVKYINQNKLQGKFAVVDIGWSGGMQRYLHEMLSHLNIEYEMKGYYIGIADYYKRNLKVVSKLDLNGYLFDFMHNARDEDKRSSFVGLFESLFLEQRGSVKNYYFDEKEEIINANRYPYEYIKNGKHTRESKCVMKIQEGALYFVKKVSEVVALQELNYTPRELFEGLNQTGNAPQKKDINMFADFRFFDEGEIRCLAAPKSFWFYCLHLKDLKKDFLLSRWKIGFMKRIFKINFPYLKIYKALLQFK